METTYRGVKKMGRWPANLSVGLSSRENGNDIKPYIYIEIQGRRCKLSTDEIDSIIEKLEEFKKELHYL